MLLGKSHKHYGDLVLADDRAACHTLLAKYNHAAGQPNLAGNDKGSLAKIMRRILKPTVYKLRGVHYGPQGSLGCHSIIEAPFTCDFGYHLHIGEETTIDKDCHFQDAGGIYIGDRVCIGPGVLITTLSLDTDPNAPKGSHGTYKAGMVKIEDDVFIGGRAIIMPYVTIGKGAKVGAGAVVTKVCAVIPGSVASLTQFCRTSKKAGQ